MPQTAPQYWLVKQEPTAYPWEQLVADKKTAWTGVRNYQARNNLRQMRTGDRVFYYHSVIGKEIVGLAEVTREAFPDPTATDGGDWVSVEIAPVKALDVPVSLEAMKTSPKLADFLLIRNSRLSVIPVTKAQFEAILKMGTKNVSDSKRGT